VAREGELHIEDPSIVAALYDPLRYRLFRLLETPQSVAELAAEVGVPANRLYYHLRRLVDCGLVRQVDARVAGRHTERIYGRTAERIRFSGELDLEAGAGGLIRGIADELEAGIRNAGDDEVASRISYHVVSLTPERAQELEERLRDLIAEYEPENEPGPGRRRFGLLGALVPLAEGSEPDADS
jgi:DNA-binding transcriptional ArsR family regulator